MKTDRELLELAASVPAMTLRDYFAAKALGGVYANPALEPIPMIEVAKYCYDMADTMLHVRAAAAIGEGME